MAKGIVDLLEAIQIQAQECGLLSITGGLGETLLDSILQQKPIRQPGEHVVMCLVKQLLMQLLAVGDILYQDKTARPPQVVDAMGRHIHLDVGAVFTAVAPGARELGGVGTGIIPEHPPRLR